MSTSMTPCPNPVICGVQNHRPGTVCRARSGSVAQDSSRGPSLSPILASADDQHSPDPQRELQVLDVDSEAGITEYDIHPSLSGDEDDGVMLVALENRDGIPPGCVRLGVPSRDNEVSRDSTHPSGGTIMGQVASQDEGWSLSQSGGPGRVTEDWVQVPQQDQERAALELRNSYESSL